MKKGISLLLLSMLFITSGCKQDKETVNEYNIVPKPNHIVPQEGRFKLSGKTKVIVPSNAPEIDAIADTLIERLKLTAGIRLKKLNDSDERESAITFVIQNDLPKEGYKLLVTPNAITVTASQANGFFYGMQTLFQLLPTEVYGRTKVKGVDWSVPAVEIEDAPRFAYRGLMLDVCRHFAPTDYIYKFIDLLAMNKMNTFHWHLTEDQGWRIEIKKHPKLTEIGSNRKETLIDYYFTNYPQQFDGKPHGGYYTQEQIKAIVAYAKSKYITVIPEIEMPGHALAALASYPELSCDPTKKYEVGTTWGVFDDVYCPSETTFKFLEEVLEEVMALFPSEYIHIGGDECPKTAWKNSAFCQDLIKKLGLKDDTVPSQVDGKKHTKEEKLQSYFITRMEKYLNSKGRNIIGWDEILEGGLAPNATVMSWRGVEGGMNAAKAGHNAIMTPGVFAYLDHYQEDPANAPTTIGGYNTLKRTYSYNPVPDNADELVKKHIIGFQGNIWREYMANSERIDYQAFPRAMAIAETGWTLNKNKDFKDFCTRMTSDFQRLELMDTKACQNFFEVNIHTHAEKEQPLKVALECYYPNAEIRYTTDGSEPTLTSTVYQEPFVLKGHMDLKAAAFKDGKKLGKATGKALYANLISGKPYSTTPAMGWTGDTFDENDLLGGDKTTFGLTNGKRGDNASYNPWCSFDMTDRQEMEFIVQMGQATTVQKVVFGSLFNPAMKILPAGGITVEVSTDGKSYRTVAEQKLSHQYPKNGRKAFTDTVSFEPTEATYLRLKIKNGGTLRSGIDFMKEEGKEVIQSELWIDEIEVY
ncbi:MAG: beta-hexosaminidase [Bacteroidia bacterium]|nr:beta-hexosaminidase [Bacteroidia bacterium]